MLLSFSLTNYKSFLEKQTLSLRARKNSDELMNLSVIFGKNAAGKSNMLKAMGDARKIIIDPDYRVWPPFFSKIGKDNDKQTTFEFEFSIKGKGIYRYSLTVITGNICQPHGFSILKEKLYSSSKGKYIINESHEPPSITTKESDWNEYGELKTRENDLREEKEKLIRRIREIESEKVSLENQKNDLFKQKDDIGQKFEKYYINHEWDEQHDGVDLATFLLYELKRNNKTSSSNMNEKEYDQIASKSYYSMKLDIIEHNIQKIEEEKNIINDKIGHISSLMDSIRKQMQEFIDENDEQNSRKIFTKSKLYEYVREKGHKSQNKSFITDYEAVYQWFSDTLTIISPDDHLFTPVEGELLSELSNIIRNFDVGIADIRFKPIYGDERARVEQIMIDREKSRMDICFKGSQNDISQSFIAKDLSGIYRLSFWHGKMKISKLVTMHSNNQESEFNYNDESDGTARLMEIAPILLKTDEEKVYLVDELDRRMHPLLTEHMIKEFISMGDDNKQLIFTSHEHTLLNGLFCPEEIWTVECVNNRSSIKHRDKEMKKCNTRADKAFIDGKIGGVPHFD